MKRLRYLTMVGLAVLALACTPDDPVDPQKKDDPQEDPKDDPQKDDPQDEPKFREEKDDDAKDPVRTFDYSKLAGLKHPRVLMTAADFDDLKTKVTSGRFENKTLYKMHKLVLDLADTYVDSKVVIKYELDASGKRLLGQSQEALKRLFACAYAYRMTGKGKYLQKAQADLKTVCSFSDWHPSHYLDVGEMALGVAIAYDWLYYDLSYEDRVRARRSMTNFALNTSTSQGFHTSEGNWNQVCNAGVMAAAIACYEKAKASSVNVIEKGIESNGKMMKAIYSPDGNYSEGYDYWGYGTGFQVIILRLLEAAFGDCAGLDRTEGFSKTAGYMLFMAGPTGADFSYADGGVGSERPKLAMWWFAAKQNDPSLLLNEMRLYEAGKYETSTEARIIPMIPCMIKDCSILDNFSGAVPSSDIWIGRGMTPIVIVHTGWKFDADDKYLGIKGGKADSGHGHMDAGSFVYDAYGVRWSGDYTRPSYSGIENALKAAGGNFWTMSQSSLRWDVAKMNNLFHSTLTFTNNDGSVSGKKHPTDHYVSGSATLEQYYDLPDNIGGKLCLTAPLKGQVKSAYRTITISGGKDLRIIDEITAPDGKDAQMQWRMMTPVTVAVEASDIKLSKNGRTMYLKAYSSDASVVPALTQWPASRPSDWTSQSWDTGMSMIPVGFTATIPAGRTVTFTTVLSPDN